MNAMTKPAPVPLPATTFGGLDSQVQHMKGLLSQRVRLLDRDAALPDPSPMPWLPATEQLDDVFSAWRLQIHQESLEDFVVKDWNKLAVDPRDGALVRGAGGLAYTPHAWEQLIGLLLQKVGKPIGVTNSVKWLRPWARGLAFADIRMRSLRRHDDEMWFRSFRERSTGLLALRAVVSGRHSGTLFDDLQLMEMLREVLRNDARCFNYRGIDETAGYAHMGGRQQLALGEKQDPANLIQTALFWRNSETGSARLSFTGAVTLTFLDDAPITGAEGRGIESGEAERELEEKLRTGAVDVMLVDETTRTSRNHTAPRKDGKRVLTDAERQTIAHTRMRSDRDKAIAYSHEMVEKWKAAVSLFAPGWQGTTGLGVKDEAAFNILLDFCEEVRPLEGEDRQALLDVLKDEKRLNELPRGSAAHVAATFAVLAARQKTGKEARRLQTVAGQWLTNGWKR